MKIKNLIFRAGCVLCSFAFVVAINTLGNMCTGSFYQPEVPKSLEKYRK